MKFEKMDDDKIKITLNLKDLEKKHIDFHSFMSNSIETQELFIDILKEAEKKIGFVTNNYNIHIETFATSDGNFIFTITRINSIITPKNKKLVYKRRLPKADKRLTIFSFNCFDDYCNFCNFLSNINYSYSGDSSLIRYNSNYYLILNNMEINTITSKLFFTYVSEFANLCTTSISYANKILEYGEKLISKNAIEVGVHYL